MMSVTVVTSRCSVCIITSIVIIVVVWIITIIIIINVAIGTTIAPVYADGMMLLLMQSWILLPLRLVLMMWLLLWLIVQMLLRLITRIQVDAVRHKGTVVGWGTL